WNFRPLLLFSVLLMVPRAEMCPRNTPPVPTKPPRYTLPTRYINVHFLSDASHCRLFKNRGEQRLYMTVMANGVRATFSGLPEDWGLGLRLVGISCMNVTNQRKVYETSVIDNMLDGNSALWGLKGFLMKRQHRFVNASVVVVFTGYKFQDISKTAYSLFAGLCSRDNVALISDADAMYRTVEEVSQHILRMIGASFQEDAELWMCADPKKDSPPKCDFTRVEELLSNVQQDCFQPKGIEVPQVTSLPGDVVNLEELCERMYPHIWDIRYCYEGEITGTHRFHPVYECKFTCCEWMSPVERKHYQTRSIQGLRCSKYNQFCVNSVCYDREPWIKEWLPNGSLDIRPDVP
ncbi:unnamed protein product, partial [Ixodes hexagonus]